jgi:hypothetical protein
VLSASEVHSGAFALGTDPSHLDRPMLVRLGWRVRSLATLRSEGIELSGELHAPGFADHRSARGRITMPSRGSLRYRVEFVSNAGQTHFFEGERTLSLKGVPAAVTVLSGRIVTSEGNEIGRALLRFDLRSDFVRFLRSIRVWLEGT